LPRRWPRRGRKRPRRNRRLRPSCRQPPDVVFVRFIALIRAHLTTGDELVAQRDWRDAQQHVNFPREEIYGVIRDDLRGYKTPHFDGSLNRWRAPSRPAA
jgi:hypothetical protein